MSFFSLCDLNVYVYSELLIIFGSFFSPDRLFLIFFLELRVFSSFSQNEQLLQEKCRHTNPSAPDLTLSPWPPVSLDGWGLNAIVSSLVNYSGMWGHKKPGSKTLKKQNGERFLRGFWLNGSESPLILAVEMLDEECCCLTMQPLFLCGYNQFVT